jgi:hypothetical protein
MIKQIYDDNRSISHIVFEDESVLSVSEQSGVEKIVPYNENGEMAPIVWFAIYAKGEIVQRVNSKYICAVVYV